VAGSAAARIDAKLIGEGDEILMAVGGTEVSCGGTFFGVGVPGQIRLPVSKNLSRSRELVELRGCTGKSAGHR
jgi:hypothetical protein